MAKSASKVRGNPLSRDPQASGPLAFTGGLYRRCGIIQAGSGSGATLLAPKQLLHLNLIYTSLSSCRNQHQLKSVQRCHRVLTRLAITTMALTALAALAWLSVAAMLPATHGRLTTLRDDSDPAGAGKVAATFEDLIARRRLGTTSCTGVHKGTLRGSPSHAS